MAKKSVTIDDYTVTINENASVEVVKENKFIFKNTIDGLREVAKELNFTPDPKEQGWNTQRYGRVPVDFAQTGKMPHLKEVKAAEKSKPKRTVSIDIYGEGVRLDVFDSEDELVSCFNALRDSEYQSIRVVEGDKYNEYSLAELGATIYENEWPEDIYDEGEEKFVEATYKQFEGKVPSDVFEFEGCDLYDAEEEGLSRIEWIQTKVSAYVDLELKEGEEFDPKKLHFMYSEFVVPDAEIEVNTGMIYDGRQYEIQLHSEREISSETIWEG